MLIEDLAIEDGRGYFDTMPDLDAYIMAWLDENDDMYYGCAVNPEIDPARELGALGWCAQLISRIEDFGFDQAMEMDGWQHRADGRWQLWGRAVDLPPI